MNNETGESTVLELHLKKKLFVMFSTCFVCASRKTAVWLALRRMRLLRRRKI